VRLENSMTFSNDQTTKEALLNTLGELSAAWARFYAIEVDSRPGELEYDRALAAAKKLEAAVAEIRRGRWRMAILSLSPRPASPSAGIHR